MSSSSLSQEQGLLFLSLETRTRKYSVAIVAISSVGEMAVRREP